MYHCDLSIHNRLTLFCREFCPVRALPFTGGSAPACFDEKCHEEVESLRRALKRSNTEIAMLRHRLAEKCAAQQQQNRLELSDLGASTTLPKSSAEKVIKALTR